MLASKADVWTCSDMSGPVGQSGASIWNRGTGAGVDQSPDYSNVSFPLFTINIMDRSRDAELPDTVQPDESFALFRQITTGMIEFSEITADDVISELHSDEDDNCQLGTAKDIISELNSSEQLSDVITDRMMQFVQNGQEAKKEQLQEEEEEDEELTILNQMKAIDHLDEQNDSSQHFSLDEQCFMDVRDDVLQEFSDLCDDRFLSFIEEFEHKINEESE
ncbi:hypothetical protein T10_3934 [Trichinella papuae]|uniref:Uncharacterized protein n=1 Tax=Trichinella papuae TaxID=268474 RepID=A0A0V1MDV4_9BILA|nr:hypothetical protein T10_3934 [Trichinella papuae]